MESFRLGIRRVFAVALDDRVQKAAVLLALLRQGMAQEVHVGLRAVTGRDLAE